MAPLLDRFAGASGRVDLGDADVYWWLLPDEASQGWLTMRSRALDRGHVAAVFDDELYEMRTGSSGARMEAVIRMRSLRSSRFWTDDDVARGLSEEAISAVASPCWHAHQELMRSVAALRRSQAVAS